METTKDGFTFKRKEPNKKMEFKCKEIAPVKSMGIQRKEEHNEFVFKVVKKNSTAKKTQNLEIKKEKSEKKRLNKNNNRSKNLNKKNIIEHLLDNKRDSKIANKKEIGQIKDKNVKSDDELVFNIIKKRKTIKMENDHDLTSEDDLQKESRLSLDDVDIVKTLEKNYSIIEMQIPILKEKKRSNEIHKNVYTNNINDLIKECIYYMKDSTPYSREIVKHCNSNYFSDVDYRKEIEQVNSKSAQVNNEIAKWKSIKEQALENNKISIPSLNGMVEDISDGMEVNDMDLVDEFEKKAERLFGLEAKLRYFFENAKEKSENLLRSIFGSLDERSVDAIFLLKAMSILAPMSTPAKDNKVKSEFFCNKMVKEFVSRISKFIKEAKRPNSNDFKTMLRTQLLAVLLIGLLPYIVKIINIPTTNFFLDKREK